MVVEKVIDDLIEAGWHVLESDFDPVAFKAWKRHAFNCLTLLVGPDHAYTQYFKGFVQEPDKHTVLAGAGLLAAAKEELTNGRLKTETDTQSEAIQ